MTASGDADAAILARTAHDVVAAIGPLPAAHRARSTHGRARTRGPCRTDAARRDCCGRRCKCWVLRLRPRRHCRSRLRLRTQPRLRILRTLDVARRAEVREIALSAMSGHGTLYV